MTALSPEEKESGNSKKDESRSNQAFQQKAESGEGIKAMGAPDVTTPLIGHACAWLNIANCKTKQRSRHGGAQKHIRFREAGLQEHIEAGELNQTGYQSNAIPEEPRGEPSHHHRQGNSSQR